MGTTWPFGKSTVKGQVSRNQTWRFCFSRNTPGVEIRELLLEHGSCFQTWVQPASRKGTCELWGTGWLAAWGPQPQGHLLPGGAGGDLMGRHSFQLLLGEALSGAAD